jgi:hypothetical protein
MADLIPWPFSLPDRFLDALGYSRVVEAFDSPAMRARLTDLLRRQGIVDNEPAAPRGPRRYVALWWEPAGDGLAFTDGVHTGAGQLHHWVWLTTCAARGQLGGPIYWLAGRAPGRPGFQRCPGHARAARRRRLGSGVGRADRARPPHRPRSIARSGPAAMTSIPHPEAW